MLAVVSLGDNFLRGRAIGFDAKTGKFLWSFDVVPGPGEPGHETWPQDSDIWKYGGGAIWTTPSVDAELGLVYLETGNAVPQWGGELRPGNNLYNNSVVALDSEDRKDALALPARASRHLGTRRRARRSCCTTPRLAGGRARCSLAMRTDGVLVLPRPRDRQAAAAGRRAPGEAGRVPEDLADAAVHGGRRSRRPRVRGQDMIPPGSMAGCYFDPIRADMPNHVHAAHEHAADADGLQPADRVSLRVGVRQPRLDPPRARPVGVHPADAAAGPEAVRRAWLPRRRTGKIAWQKRLAYAGCEGGGGATATAGGLVFHAEPDGSFQAYDAKTGDVRLAVSDRATSGFGGGAGPGGGPAMTYESRGEQYVALTMNHGRSGRSSSAEPLPPRPAAAPPRHHARVGRADRGSTAAVQLGTVSDVHHCVARAGRIDWANDYGLTPPRVRTKAGTAVTFANTSKLRTRSRRATDLEDWRSSRASRVGDDREGPVVYDYACKDHPWTIGQLIVE